MPSTPDFAEAENFTIDELAASDPEAAEAAYQDVTGRHWLAVLRQESGRTLAQVGNARGVTKAAAAQAENRPFESLKVGTCLGQIRGCGYDVDEKWFIDALTTALANAQRV